MSSESLHQRFRDLTVREAHDIMPVDPITVPATATIQELADVAARAPATRVLAVTDPDGRLAGIISLRRLSFCVLASVLPERALRLAQDAASMREFVTVTRGHTAADVMDEAASLSLDTPLDEAFERLMALHLDGLPVVDGDERVVGYLDTVEVLLAWLRLRAEGGP